MRFEIQKHWEKLKKISKLNDAELETSYAQILSKIKFINEEIIPVDIWITSEKITKNIDIDDIDFCCSNKIFKSYFMVW
ncbi:PIN domain-containing protein [Flavobacterium sp.]|uniref:PIN domain-containing protein n=1 Tax=Flavobacterium sp. TaxID=239 RepID=UPI003751FCE0